MATNTGTGKAMPAEVRGLLERCSRDERAGLRRAFERDGATWITEGRMAVELPGTGYEGAWDGQPDEICASSPLDCGQFFIVAFCAGHGAFRTIEGVTVRRKEIPCADCGGKGYLRRCSRCNGYGEIECCECGQERPCEKCHGVGWQPCEKPQGELGFVGIGGSAVEPCEKCKGAKVVGVLDPLTIETHGRTYGAEIMLILAELAGVNGLRLADMAGYPVASHGPVSAVPFLWGAAGSEMRGIVMPLRTD